MTSIVKRTGCPDAARVTAVMLIAQSVVGLGVGAGPGVGFAVGCGVGSAVGAGVGAGVTGSSVGVAAAGVGDASATADRADEAAAPAVSGGPAADQEPQAATRRPTPRPKTITRDERGSRRSGRQITSESVCIEGHPRPLSSNVAKIVGSLAVRECHSPAGRRRDAWIRKTTAEAMVASVAHTIAVRASAVGFVGTATEMKSPVEVGPLRTRMRVAS